MWIPELFADSYNEEGLNADVLLPASERKKSREEWEKWKEEWEKEKAAKSADGEGESSELRSPDPDISDEQKELHNYFFDEGRPYNARDFAPVLKSAFDRLAGRVEAAERLGVELEPTQWLTNEELRAVKAAFTDEDYQNFLAARETPAQDPDGQETLPTQLEYEKAIGRRLSPRRR